MKYVSGRIVWDIYTWLGWSGEGAEPIGSSVPVRYKYPAQSFHWHTWFTCLWWWNRYWVPKRRKLELRRRGITQKGTNYTSWSLIGTVYISAFYKTRFICFLEYSSAYSGRSVLQVYCRGTGSWGWKMTCLLLRPLTYFETLYSLFVMTSSCCLHCLTSTCRSSAWYFWRIPNTVSMYSYFSFVSSFIVFTVTIWEYRGGNVT